LVLGHCLQSVRMRCAGECTDVTVEWLDVEGSFSMTFSEDGTVNEVKEY